MKNAYKIISAFTAVVGIVLFWLGMIYGFGRAGEVHMWGLAIALAGLLGVVFAYPIYLLSSDNKEE